MNRLLILIVVFAGSFLNIAFINRNEPEIKGLICGSDLYMNILKNNFSLEDLYTGEPQNKIESEFEYDENEYFYSFYIDINTGNLFLIDDDSSNNYVTYMIPLGNNSETNQQIIDIKYISSIDELISTDFYGDINVVEYYSFYSRNPFFLVIDSYGNRALLKLNSSASPQDFMRILDDYNVISATYHGDMEIKVYSKKKGNLIEISEVLYMSSFNLKSTTYKITLNLSKLISTYMSNGEKVKDKCMYFPLPGIVEIKN